LFSNLVWTDSLVACSISNNYLTNFGIDMTGVKAIADALSVSSSMTSLK